MYNVFCNRSLHSFTVGDLLYGTSHISTFLEPSPCEIYVERCPDESNSIPIGQSRNVKSAWDTTAFLPR